MMYVVCDFSSKNKFPKYLEPVVSLMADVNDTAFLNSVEYECFKVVLKRELEERRAASSTKSEPYFYFSPLDLRSSGQISLYDKKDAEYSVARLSVFMLRGILEYDPDKMEFLNVSDQLVRREGGVEHVG